MTWLVIKIAIFQNKMKQSSISEKQEKTKVKIFALKWVFFLEKGKIKVNLLKIKLIIDMLYIVYIQFNFSSSVLKSCL